MSAPAFSFSDRLGLKRLIPCHSLTSPNKGSTPPHTSSASTHSSTTLSKKRRNISRPKRSRMRVREEWSGRGSNGS